MKPHETPLFHHNNVAVKMEALQPGGSHKARAARRMIREALVAGHLSKGGGRRIIEKSGGNLGVGLAFEAQRHGIAVDLVIGLSFSPLKRRLCQHFGANLIGENLLRAGFTPRQAITHLMKQDPDRWFFTDQFINPANLNAHLEETGPELVRQVAAIRQPGQGIILVKGAGTGASFEGISRCLRDAFGAVRCELVVPSGCDIAANVFVDHPLEGFAVGVRPPFLDLGYINAVHQIAPDVAMEGQAAMARHIGFFPGMTSGANYAAALSAAARHPNALIVTLAYDSGESYIRAASDPAPPTPQPAHV